MENYKETNSFQEQIDIKVNPTFHDNNYWCLLEKSEISQQPTKRGFQFSIVFI